MNMLDKADIIGAGILKGKNKSQKISAIKVTKNMINARNRLSIKKLTIAL